jgi:hypothetical protein
MKNILNNRVVKKYNIKQIVTIDLGKNMAFYYDPDKSDKTFKITHQELLDLPNKYENTLFVSEGAHMDRPRTMKSHAQAFKEDELNLFKDNCKNNNNLLRLFPEMMSFQTRQEGEEKSDELDPIHLYRYLEENPNFIDVLKNPSSNYNADPKRREGWSIKDNMNTALNYARRTKYGKDDYWSIREWLENNIEEINKNIDDTTKKVFEVSYYKKGNVKKSIQQGDVNVNALNNGIYSIIMSLFEFSTDEDINVVHNFRKREETGDLPGWGFLEKYVYHFSPFHLKGGIARSNLKFHNYKTYLAKRAVDFGYKMEKKKLNGKAKNQFNPQEESFFKQAQKEHKNACKQMFYAVKKAVRNNLINEMQ